MLKRKEHYLQHEISGFVRMLLANATLILQIENIRSTGISNNVYALSDWKHFFFQNTDQHKENFLMKRIKKILIDRAFE